MRVSTAVIAVAGYGTRFLPATKVQPKELMPIVDKPVIQYLVEEVVASGIERIVLVTRPGAHDLADHFTDSPGLESQLAQEQKFEQLEAVQRLSRMASFAIVRQGTHLPYGNGTPILAAKAFIPKDEAFVYMFGDDLVLSTVPCVRQLLDIYESYQPGAVVAVQDIPRSETYRYGIVRIKSNSEPFEMAGVVEKPSPEDAPSTLAQFGRFVLSSRVIEILEEVEPGKGNELWLTDALHKLSSEQKVLVHPVDGKWYTMGDPLRFLIASIEYGLRHPEIGKSLAEYLSTLQLPPGANS